MGINVIVLDCVRAEHFNLGSPVLHMSIPHSDLRDCFVAPDSQRECRAKTHDCSSPDEIED